MTQPTADSASDARPRWRISWLQAIACVLVLTGVAVFLYPHAASWFSQREQSRVTAISMAQMEEPPNNDPEFRAAELERAHEYNHALGSGALLEANSTIPTGQGESAGDDYVYEDLLNTSGTGFMGRLQYDELDIDLPIYHGTDDATLLQGVGHLEGTSLPVGGEGTRSVLTAHRGLPSATLFNDLDESRIGDTFSVAVLDQVITYRVVDIQVIDPTDTEILLPNPDRDLLTLVTCTPLGVNSHRIIVTGERLLPTPESDVLNAGDRPELPGFPWWAIVLGGTVLGGGSYVWWSGRPRKPASPIDHM